MWKVSVKGETDLPPFPALQIRDQTGEEAARASSLFVGVALRAHRLASIPLHLPLVNGDL